MKVTDKSYDPPIKINVLSPRPLQPHDAGQVSGGNREATITLSRTAETVATAAKRVKKMPDVDMAKVARVKAMLENGTYQVDAEKAASNMLTESLLKD